MKWKYNIMIFNDTNLYGYDISLYQDNNNTPQGVNFATMKASGADFVIIRAGQNLWIDPDFATNWTNAKAAGIPRASYWYYDPRVNPVMQAKMFKGLFANDKPEGRLWIDLEFPASWGGSYGNPASWMAFIEELKFNGYRVGIYTGYYWWLEHTTAADRAYYAQYPLWLAWYTSNPSIVQIPAPWSQCRIWQDGTPAIGISVGVESLEIDHNKFNGGATEFAAEFGAQVTPPTTGGTMATTGTTVLQVKVFDTPSTSGRQIATIGAGVVFDVTAQNGDWLTRTAGGYVNVMKSGVQAVIVHTTTAPPPVEPPTAGSIVTNIITVYSDGSINVTPQ
jgi:GH25 family lysozyme M1 (1,4-beta-N-acetylmuramidase)